MVSGLSARSPTSSVHEMSQRPPAVPCSNLHYSHVGLRAATETCCGTITGKREKRGGQHLVTSLQATAEVKSWMICKLCSKCSPTSPLCKTRSLALPPGVAAPFNTRPPPANSSLSRPFLGLQRHHSLSLGGPLAYGSSLSSPRLLHPSFPDLRVLEPSSGSSLLFSVYTHTLCDLVQTVLITKHRISICVTSCRHCS